MNLSVASALLKSVCLAQEDAASGASHRAKSTIAPSQEWPLSANQASPTGIKTRMLSKSNAVSPHLHVLKTTKHKPKHCVQQRWPV